MPGGVEGKRTRCSRSPGYTSQPMCHVYSVMCGIGAHRFAGLLPFCSRLYSDLLGSSTTGLFAWCGAISGSVVAEVRPRADGDAYGGAASARGSP